MTFTHLFCTSAITIGVSTISLARQQEYRYAVMPLETLGGLHSYGRGLDVQGNVIGDAFVPDPGGFHATIWFGGLENPIDLGTLGGRNSKAHSTNSSGWVVGRADLISGYHACLWRDLDPIDLGTLGGDRSEAWDVNEQGVVVGWADEAPPSNHRTAFRWIDGQLSPLGSLYGESSVARAVNELGQIVGQTYHPPTGLWRAVLWEDGNILDLGTLRSDGEGVSYAYDINDLGHVVGSSETDQFDRDNAFLWADGRMYNLGRLPGTKAAHAEAINNLVQVVGFSTRGAPDSDAFLWEQGQGMRNLNELIAPRARWWLRLALDINDAGQITGWGERTYDPNRTVGYILSPVNPTLQLEAPSPGRAGEANTLTVSNCTPGATVQFLYSRFGGGTRIPGCDLQQNALQLDSPTVIGTAIADANGVASITRTVPPVVRNQTILFQAVVQSECAISQLVVHQFE